MTDWFLKRSPLPGKDKTEVSAQPSVSDLFIIKSIKREGLVNQMESIFKVNNFICLQLETLATYNSLFYDMHIVRERIRLVKWYCNSFFRTLILQTVA